MSNLHTIRTNKPEDRRRHHRLVLGVVASIVPMIASGAAHAQVQAGTVITNTATLHIPQAGGADQAIPSNPAMITVVEQLDVGLTSTGSDAISVSTTGATVPVVLTNRGNGQEAFVVVATPADASVGVKLIAIDGDGDGRYDPAHDTTLTDGHTPSLAPGGTLALLVVLTRAQSPVTAASLTIAATAATGSGDPGTVFAGKGDGGGDAVTGRTGAHAQLSVPIVTADTAAPTLAKTQTVRAPDGSATPVRGAIVTYVLAAHFSGATSGAHVHDAVPAGTAYVAGSLRLDMVALTDAADVDGGVFDGTAIDVALGDVPGAAIRTVQFQVTIQ